jgi:hypothetical protein
MCAPSVLGRRGAGGALPGLCTELCHDISVLERAIASTRRFGSGFVPGFAHVGVDDPRVDVADKPKEATDDERKKNDDVQKK